MNVSVNFVSEKLNSEISEKVDTLERLYPNPPDRRLFSQHNPHLKVQSKERKKVGSIIGTTYCGSELKEELCIVCKEPLEMHTMEANHELIQFFFQFDDILMGTAQYDILVTESLQKVAFPGTVHTFNSNR